MRRNPPQAHQHLIHEGADGAQIQWQNVTGEWLDTITPLWNPITQYRIRPDGELVDGVWQSPV